MVCPQSFNLCRFDLLRVDFGFCSDDHEEDGGIETRLEVAQTMGMQLGRLDEAKANQKRYPERV